MASLLPDHAKQLYEARQEMLGLLLSDDITRMGLPLRDFPYNSELKSGPDFGGTKSSSYLPAAKRYYGRFYRELGDEGVDLLLNRSHHGLIISGLYGLVTPAELIQAYSCHVLDHPGIPDTWISGGLLTSLLLAYLREFEIQRVFDLTAERPYRKLINFSRVRSKVEVLRPFGSQNVGHDLLPSLGALCRDHLLRSSEDELLNITLERPFDATFEDLRFSLSDIAPDGYIADEPVTVVERELNSTPNSAARHQRIPITSSSTHTTIFGRPVRSLEDLPSEARVLFEEMSLVSAVQAVHLGRFASAGPKGRSRWGISLLPPQPDSGRLLGMLRGPGEINVKQVLGIRVSLGREIEAFLQLSNFPWVERNYMDAVSDEPPDQAEQD